MVFIDNHSGTQCPIGTYFTLYRTQPGYKTIGIVVDLPQHPFPFGALHIQFAAGFVQCLELCNYFEFIEFINLFL